MRITIRTAYSVRRTAFKDCFKRCTQYSVLGTDHGFSLIEVILALAILILGLVGIILLFPVGLRASRQAGVLSEGTLVAQSRLEEIKTFGYDKIEAMEGTHSSFGWKIAFDEIAPEGVEDPSGLRKAVVTVTWTQGGQERTETFVTMVSQ